MELSVEEKKAIEIKRFSELYKPKEGIGEQALVEIADEVLSFSKDYISKDKIREKLDYQYMLWNTPNRQKEYNQEVVDILEELLEEK